ncbi:RNA polymerase I associated factor A49-like protein [Peniophora sp. CONT]|nr:RNA polymerase I associated factor A49-like protein [Peniophora sp. CONT]
MSDSLHASKKRKRASSLDGEVKLDMRASTSHPGPAVVMFPSVKPSRSTGFDVQPQRSDRAQEFAMQRSHITAENDTVEFYGASVGKDDSGCQYHVAVYHPSAKKIILQPAPLFTVAREVKALKSFRSSAPSASERIAARNALGEAFGTKKAKANIRAYERNKVDVGALENVAGALQDRIDLGTENLPSQEEAQEQADASRLIPAYNINASTPEEVYPLHNIVPESEWNALDSIVSSIKAASDHVARLKCLPYTRSSWVGTHIKQAFHSDSKPKTSTLKMLVYVATLLTFRAVAGKHVPEREKLLEKMAPSSEIVVDGLLSRFTENARGSTSRSMTGSMDALLLAHVFALCLKVDHFATDTAIIAADLKLGTTKVNNQFKSLGCNMKDLPVAEMKRLGLPSSAATKRAVLTTPLTFPKPRTKRRV